MSFDFPRRDVRGGDTGILAEFYIEAVELTFKSEQTGKPEFEDREFIRILVAGDAKNEVRRLAMAEDKQRFAEQYRAFKNGVQDIAQSGTPLSAWPAMTPAVIRTFNAVNIFTVEQLAGVSDTAIQSGPLGLREWALKAKGYLEHASDTAAATRLAADNARKDEQIADLQRQISELARRVPVADDGGDFEDEEPAPRRRGRPPGTRVAA